MSSDDSHQVSYSLNLVLLVNLYQSKIHNNAQLCWAWCHSNFSLTSFWKFAMMQFFEQIEWKTSTFSKGQEIWTLSPCKSLSILQKRMDFINLIPAYLRPHWGHVTHPWHPSCLRCCAESVTIVWIDSLDWCKLTLVFGRVVKISGTFLNNPLVTNPLYIFEYKAFICNKNYFTLSNSLSMKYWSYNKYSF